MKLTKLGRELATQFENYKNTDDRAVPVLAMTYDESNKKFSNHTWNKKQVKGMTNKDYHAEMLLIDSLVGVGKPIDIIITLSPCFDCLIELYRSNKVRNIYFIFSKTWTNNNDEVVVKKIIEDSKTKIKRIKFPKSMSKKSTIGINNWGDEIRKHLNSTKRINKKGKIKYNQDNYTFSLIAKNK